MSELLAKAFGEAQRLTDGDQADLAEFIRAFVLARTAVEPHDLTVGEQACVDAGMAEAERGEFISDKAAEDLLRKPWK